MGIKKQNKHMCNVHEVYNLELKKQDQLFTMESARQITYMFIVILNLTQKILTKNCAKNIILQWYRIKT